MEFLESRAGWGLNQRLSHRYPRKNELQPAGERVDRRGISQKGNCLSGRGLGGPTGGFRRKSGPPGGLAVRRGVGRAHRGVFGENRAHRGVGPPVGFWNVNATLVASQFAAIVTHGEASTQQINIYFLICLKEILMHAYINYFFVTIRYMRIYITHNNRLSATGSSGRGVHDLNDRDQSQSR